MADKRHGQGYERAVTACRGALNRSVPSAVAREAFIGACIEANMHTSAVAAQSKSILASRSASGELLNAEIRPRPRTDRT